MSANLIHKMDTRLRNKLFECRMERNFRNLIRLLSSNKARKRDAAREQFEVDFQILDQNLSANIARHGPNFIRMLQYSAGLLARLTRLKQQLFECRKSLLLAKRFLSCRCDQIRKLSLELIYSRTELAAVDRIDQVARLTNQVDEEIERNRLREAEEPQRAKSKEPPTRMSSVMQRSSSEPALNSFQHKKNIYPAFAKLFANRLQKRQAK